MAKFITSLPPHIINPILSAIAIIIGALVGAFFSWIITKKSTDRTIEVQNKIYKESRKYEECMRVQKNKECANVIRLDICTALFQSIRILKKLKKDEKQYIYPIPMDREYALSVAYMKSHFDLKELSYIYQLYGVIEKLNKDTSGFIYSEGNYENIKIDCLMFLEKIYDKNVEFVLDMDIDKVRYNELYENSYIKTGYKNVLEKLDRICIEEK